MKKLYTICSIALGMTLLGNSAQAAISSVSDLYGEYNAVYYWGWGDDGAPDFLILPTISAGDAENEVKISNLFPTVGNDFAMTANIPIVGTVDIANKTITVKANQILGTDQYGTNTLVLQNWNNNTGEWQLPDQMVLSISDNGDIAFPVTSAVALETTYNGGGAWYFYMGLLFQPYSGKYERPASAFVGDYTADFEWDCVDGNYQPVNPPTQQLITPSIKLGQGENEILITNLYPYIGDYEIKATVLPSGDIKVPGYQYWNVGFVEYDLYLLGEDGVLDYMVGSVDDKGVIKFPENTEIAMGKWQGLNANNMNFQGWNGYYEISLIPSSEDDNNAVESLFDDENAPVKYYNIQGVEIKNPEKGQLVIKKQGKKTTKILVR